MNRTLRICILSPASYFLLTGIAHAGALLAQGNVTVIDNVNQMQGIVGTGDFNEGMAGGVPAGVYAGEGMTWRSGLLTGILPGCVTPGSGTIPSYQTGNNYFPGPIGGGGVANGSFAYHAGVVTFDQAITQVGLVASRNGTQYLTAWDTNGNMLGQVRWTPANDSAFIGIDTNGVPVGMVAYGNDDLWGGGSYSIGGSTIISDSWVWGVGVPCESADDCMDDNNPCTGAPICEDGACLNPPDDNGVCPDDGESCTLDVCQDGLCQHPNNPDGLCPDDGNECTNEMCQAGSCEHIDNNNPCDDMSACTENDACSNGSCDGDELVCEDQNLCTIAMCNPEIGCEYTWQPGCCVVQEDCAEGEICLFGSNSCIPDPNPGDGDGDTGDGDGDTGDGDGDTGDGDGDSGDGDGDPGDGDGDPAETSGGNEDSDTGDSMAGDTGSTGFIPFNDDDSVGDDGCNCSTDNRGAGALFGLLGLALLGTLRRRRDDD
jgi:MYXO-CTERM domain-containing protein